jgi:putative ABC transport system permease protein
VGFLTIHPPTRNPLRDIKPGSVFRKELPRPNRNWPYYVTIAVSFLFFTGMVLWQLQDVRIGLYFVLGAVGLILITAALAELLLFGLRRSRIKPLPARQALRGLFRPRNATRSIIVTLAASLAVLFTIYLIERNLDASFVESYPDDAPNLFFIDIQPDQLEAFARTLGYQADYFPVVRATIRAVNDQPLNREVERERDGDNLARTFSLTYRDHLLEGESLLDGQSLFRADWNEVEEHHAIHAVDGGLPLPQRLLASTRLRV